MRLENMLKEKGDGQSLLMTGNEAIARGAVEAGISLAAGYPGTPSSEVLEDLSLVSEPGGLYTEWSSNEKVAFETAYGASMTGLRSMVTMKHEGGNVILDSLSKMVYTGVKGGFLVLTSDDPGALSSSNEQDNRFLGQFVDMPVLEPSSPQESKDMTRLGFELSERYNLAFMLRTVTRISHGKSRVTLGPISEEKPSPRFDRNDGITDRWFCCAFNHLEKNRAHRKDMAAFLKDYVAGSDLNRVEGDGACEYGIITSGIAYNFIKEALGRMGLAEKTAILKLGVVYPLDPEYILSFIKGKKKLLVLEESDPFLEKQVREILQLNELTQAVMGQMNGYLERPGELTNEKVWACLAKAFDTKPPELDWRQDRGKAEALITQRPLTMCTGCPHRGTHLALLKAIKQAKVKDPVIFGDIGCYELGHEPPFDDMHSIYNMGAGVGLANGIAHSGCGQPAIALIGDSTFLHSGLPGLTNAVHGQADLTMVVFDNSTIAMTGHQASINSERNAAGSAAPGVDITKVVESLGCAYCKETDAFDIKSTQKAIAEALTTQGPSVVVVKGACALEHDRIKRRQGIVVEPYRVDADKCKGCRICTDKFGCQALVWDQESEKASVDPMVCNGCGVCVQVCPTGAFMKD